MHPCLHILKIQLCITGIHLKIYAKPVTRVNFLKLRFIHLKEISFTLMYGLLGLDNNWPRFNYLKIWNLRGAKKLKH